MLSVCGAFKVHLKMPRILARVLSFIYMSGVLYMGLRPNPCERYLYKVLLTGNFGWHDFAINTVGFLPLGYLLMISFENWQKDRRAGIFKRAVVICGLGILVSLFLEVSQYYLIPGRQSSFMDLAANTIGTLAGIAIYLFIGQQRTHRQRTRGLCERSQAL